MIRMHPGNWRRWLGSWMSGRRRMDFFKGVLAISSQLHKIDTLKLLHCVTS